MSTSMTANEQQLSDATYRCQLDDGLLLRWSTQADTEGVATLYGSVFRDKEPDPFNEAMAQWTRDWMSDRHPHITSGDIALVEELASGRIVAATGLLSYPIEYEGIQIPFAQPEIVATVPEFRNRGLIRRIFAMIHARSATKGHILQGITGIPYYYRQFGYEYAVDLDGERLIQTSSIPALKEGETEAFTLRRATVEDIPYLQRFYNSERQYSSISALIPDVYWHWMLADADPASAVGIHAYLIVDSDDHVVGYTMTSRYRWGNRFTVRGLWLDEVVSVADVVPSLLRGWFTIGQNSLQRKLVEMPFTRIFTILVPDHPLYNLLGNDILQTPGEPYAWYMRIPNYATFLRTMKPLLEQRLAASSLANYSGTMTIDLYRSGLKLVFSKGELSEIVPWKRGDWEEAQVSCPPFIFTQLLLAHRTYDQIRTIIPDLFAENTINAELVRTLFPARRSLIVALV